MRVAIQTWGTEGDIRPFVALGGALAARGHSVELAYTSIESRDFKPLAEASGLRARSIAADYFEANRERLAARGREAFRDPSPLRQVRSILEDLMDPVAPAMLEAGRALASNADVFISHFLAYPGHVAAEAARVPHVLVGLVPMFPSAHYGPIGMPSIAPFHRVAWWIADRVFESIFGPRIHAMRAEVGLPKLQRVLDPALDRAALGLVAVSPSLFSRPADWSPRAEVCGFLALPERQEPWAPDAALASFLASGPAPAFLSFGSLFNLDHARTRDTVRLLGEAVLRAGQRGIVQAPEAVLRMLPPPPPPLHYLSRAPHHALFPRCSVIVHHGGAGTTQSALVAGKPSIVVPHAADQFYWGALLHRLGAGTAPLRATRLTASRLAARLKQAEAPALTARAAELGAELGRERGAERAAQRIEEALR